jgi:hypothetical protein
MSIYDEKKVTGIKFGFFVKSRAKLVGGTIAAVLLVLVAWAVIQMVSTLLTPPILSAWFEQSALVVAPDKPSSTVLFVRVYNPHSQQKQYTVEVSASSPDAIRIGYLPSITKRLTLGAKETRILTFDVRPVKDDILPGIYTIHVKGRLGGEEKIILVQLSVVKE